MTADEMVTTIGRMAIAKAGTEKILIKESVILNKITEAMETKMAEGEDLKAQTHQAPMAKTVVQIKMEITDEGKTGPGMK